MAEMPRSPEAMRRHMMAEPPGGHGAEVPDDMPMADMEARHSRMHSGSAGHEHQGMMVDTSKYAPVSFVKGHDDLVEGWGMPFYGPFKGEDGIGRDSDGEFFSPRTDFLLDWFKGQRPTLYQHTLDEELGTEAVGSAVSHEKRDLGMWVRAQLDMRSRYYEKLRELISQGALSYSSGAYPIGVRIAKTGEILRWPWVEISLTPTPANPYASLRAMKAIPVEDAPPPLPGLRRLAIIRPRRMLKAAWSSSYINDLPDSAFACIDSGGRHYPHHDAQGNLDLPHLRAAMSRIGDPANAQCGRGHLEAHARAAGIGDR